MEKNQIHVSLVSLGCPKNLVDSEVMVGRLAGGSFVLQSEPAGADVVVVNTCGFIDPAREESVDTICEMLELKARGDIKGVVVAGCMVRRYGVDLARELPDVDAFLDISDYSDAPDVFRKISESVPGEGSPARTEAGLSPFMGGGKAKGDTTDFGRALLTLPHTAYLRISEGCDRQCSFCAIPLIRGKQNSKPIPVLVEEARALADGGVRELSLIGEETSAYGSDIGLRPGEGVVQLLRALGEVEGIEWIRLLYAHPGSFRQELVEEIRDNPKVARYVDMPIQHGDDTVLKGMKRGTPLSRIREVVDSLRTEVPGITLRTTILVGFPGEGEKEFENLIAYLEEAKFDRLGCFTWSPEEGTSSYDLDHRAGPKVAAERRRRVMTTQRQIAAERNEGLVGHKVDVLVDRLEAEGAIGRTEGDAPDIDCCVRLKGKDLTIGSFEQAVVTGTDGYDLEARVITGEEAES